MVISSLTDFELCCHGLETNSSETICAGIASSFASLSRDHRGIFGKRNELVVTNSYDQR